MDGEKQRRNQFLKTTVVESEIEKGKKIPSKKSRIGDHFHGEKLLNCEFLLLLTASAPTAAANHSQIFPWKFNHPCMKNEVTTH